MRRGLPIILLLIAGLTGSAGADSPPADLSVRARLALRQVMERDRSPAMLHAGEALIAFGEGDRVRAFFLENLTELQATPRRFGLWRQLATTSPTATERAGWIARIETVLLDPAGRNRINALENLCKLQYPLTGPALAVARKTAEGPSATDATFALWALDRAGDPDASPKLSTLLASPDPAVRKLAAYSLRWIKPTDPEIQRQIARAADSEPTGTEAYSYLLSAALIVIPQHPQANAWREKLEQVLATGKGNDRYQACHALLPHYRQSALVRLTPLLQDPDPDGRVSAAWIILYVWEGR